MVVMGPPRSVMNTWPSWGCSRRSRRSARISSPRIGWTEGVPIAYRHGLRASEVVGLEWHQVELDDDGHHDTFPNSPIRYRSVAAPTPSRPADIPELPPVPHHGLRSAAVCVSR